MARTRGGRRYPLVVYTMMINRWWPAILTLGLAMLALAWGVRSWGFERWRWSTLGVIGAFLVLLGFFMITIRKTAYVQPFDNHLRLVTPFLRLNISYKRLHKTSSANIGALFPPRSVSNWKKGIIEPIAKMTAIVVELYAFPVSPVILKFFLSPLFFKDKTPHFVILVDDWMRFSSELESKRVGGTGEQTGGRQIKRDTSILSRLPREK
jgi:hypothetical protein